MTARVTDQAIDQLMLVGIVSHFRQTESAGSEVLQFRLWKGGGFNRWAGQRARNGVFERVVMLYFATKDW